MFTSFGKDGLKQADLRENSSTEGKNQVIQKTRLQSGSKVGAVLHRDWLKRFKLWRLPVNFPPNECGYASVRRSPGPAERATVPLRFPPSVSLRPPALAPTFLLHFKP